MMHTKKYKKYKITFAKNFKIGYWSFAIINNKLAEIHFDKTKTGKPKFRGHCYVKKSEYKTKQEQKMIADDIKMYRFTYRNKKYIRKEVWRYPPASTASTTTLFQLT